MRAMHASDPKVLQGRVTICLARPPQLSAARWPCGASRAEREAAHEYKALLLCMRGLTQPGAGNQGMHALAPCLADDTIWVLTFHRRQPPN